MLKASRQIGLFDRYRVPYVVEQSNPGAPVRITRADGDGPQLLAVGSRTSAPEQAYVFDGAVLYAALAETATISAVLNDTGLDWTETTPILDLDGVQRAAVQIASDGSIFLPFDLDAPLDALLEERYLGGVSRIRELAHRGYYGIRPLLPRQVQLAVRRHFRRVQERATFPSWPVETSFHRLEALILGLVEKVAGEPLLWLSTWPDPYGWAVVLTHDVESAIGYANVHSVREVEERSGLRSAWYFVPERDYKAEESLLDELRASDCEIGLHGLRHDGRDMSRSVFPTRLKAMQEYATSWNVHGFRGPSTHRDKLLLQQLGVEHDSSWSDVARYEPQPGGCCSWMPFFLGPELIELPITLVQDHTLFELRGEHDEVSWLTKAAFLRDHEGMALMLTHPDYLNSPERLAAYERFVVRQAADPTAWQALPHEVATWWRQRAASHIELRDGSWTVVGPAASEARIRVGSPAPPLSGNASDMLDDLKAPLKRSTAAAR